jgi:hypothetical protein
MSNNKLVTFRGVRLEYYLDPESESALPKSLHEHANWFIHIGRATNRKPPNEEIKDVERLISQLESAIKTYSILTLSNQGRILEFKAKDMLDEILRSAKIVQDEPLGHRRKLENLYDIFYGFGHPDLGKKTFGRDNKPTRFQIFMAVVVRHVENEESKSVDQFISRVTKQYRRYFLEDK